MDTQLLVRVVVSVVSAVNAVVAMLGIPALDVNEEQIYTVVSVFATIGAWGWGFWKNNSFTAAAKQADELMHDLKAAEESKE